MSFSITAKELSAGADYIDALEAISTALGANIEMSYKDKLNLFLGRTVVKGNEFYKLSIDKTGIVLTVDLSPELVIDIMDLYRDITLTMVPSVVGFITAMNSINTIHTPRIEALVAKHNLI